MTSLVAAALDAMGSENSETIETRLSHMHKRVDEERDKFVASLKEQYVSLLPWALSECESTRSSVERMNKDMQNELAVVRIMANQLGQHDHNAPDNTVLQDQLQETLSVKDWLSGLVQLATDIEDIHAFNQPNNNMNNHCTVAKLIAQVDDKINELTECGEFDKELQKGLRDEIIMCREELMYSLYAWWGNTVNWVIDDQHKITKLTLKIEIDQDENVINNLDALEAADCLETKLSILSDCVISNLVLPIVESGNIIELQVDNQEQFITFTMSHMQTHTKGYNGVFSLLTELCDNLGQRFMNYNVHKNGDETSLNSLFGSSFTPKLMEILMEKVLKPAVPSNPKEHDVFDNLINQANMFESKMRLLSLIGEDQPSLTSFAENRSEIFVKKRCQKVLTDARELIKDLHNTVEVQQNENENIYEIPAVSKLASQFENSVDGSIDVKQIKLETIDKLTPLFKFPKCKISLNMSKFVNLLEETVCEAVNCDSAELGASLLHSTRDMLELYIALTPVIHDKQIEAVPSLAAVFYNNCYYIAHRLMTLGWEISPKASKLLDLSATNARWTYVDFVPSLREMASNSIGKHIAKAKTEITIIMNETNGFVEICEPKNLANFERALKGCLMSLEHMDKVWKEVLTPVVRMKAMGCIVSHMLRCVNNCVLSVEDITSDDSAHIYDVITRIIPTLQVLFVVSPDPSLIHKFCEREYYRCKEIQKCVNGTLSEIDDRWSCGKGPLAQWLTSLEVRQLIRALFQTSERRANVLGKIK